LVVRTAWIVRMAGANAGLAQAGRSALGALVAGVLAEWAPLPHRLCYVVLLAATAAAGVLVLRIPEATRGGHGWHVQRPHVPRGARRLLAAPLAHRAPRRRRPRRSRARARLPRRSAGAEPPRAGGAARRGDRRVHRLHLRGRRRLRRRGGLARPPLLARRLGR